LELLLGPERNLLGQVATHLGDLRIVPENFIWTAVRDTNEARIYLIFDTDRARLSLLADAFRCMAGIRRICRGSPDDGVDPAVAEFFPLVLSY
jgi:hypothetical protein